MSERKNDLPAIPELSKLRDVLSESYARAESKAASSSGTWATHRRRSLVLAVAGVATAVLIATAVISEGDRASIAPLTVKEALAAVAEASLDNPQPNRDQYLYQRATNAYISGGSGSWNRNGKPVHKYSSLVEAKSESWTSAVHCGLSRHTSVGRKFPTERDRKIADRLDRFGRRQFEELNRKRRARGQKPLEFQYWSIGMPGQDEVMALPAQDESKVRLGREKLTRRELRSFPTEPAAIYRRVRRATRGYAGSGAFGQWQAIDEALLNPNLPNSPQLRAGLINALAYVPGVESIGNETDPTGRQGVGFALESDGMRHHVIFDADTGMQMHTELSVVSKSQLRHYGSWPLGTVVFSLTTHERSVVDRPPAGLKPDIRLSGFEKCR